MGSLAGSYSDRTLPPMKMASFVPACPACIKVFGRAPWIEMSWRISALPCRIRRSPIPSSLLWPKPTYRRTFSGELSFSWLGHRKLNGSPIRERRVSAGHPLQKPLAEGPTGYSAVCMCSILGSFLTYRDCIRHCVWIWEKFASFQLDSSFACALEVKHNLYVPNIVIRNRA